MKVLIQNTLFHCFTSQLLLKLAFWDLACSVYTKILFLTFFYNCLTFKLLIWYRLPFLIFAVASSGWGRGVDPKLFLFHRVLGEVKALIQNFLFHRVLGKVKIWAIVSPRPGGRSMFYKHLLLFINLSQVKVAVNKLKLGKCCSNSEAFWQIS